MTDELLYERLALSFVDGAFLPTLHGEHVDVYAVLYPFLLMPVFAVVDLPDAVRVGARAERRALRERRDPDLAARARARALAVRRAALPRSSRSRFPGP